MAKRAVPMRVSADARDDAPPPSSRIPKLPVLLVSTDDGLWPQLSPLLSADLAARQFDTVDELIAGTPAGQNAVVLWDARGEADVAGVLTRLQVHSSRLAVAALDEAASAARPDWVSRQKQQQVVAVLGLPATAPDLAAVLAAAREEAGVRVALLGENADPQGATRERRARSRTPAGGAASPSAAGVFGKGPTWLPFALGGVAFAALAGAAAFFWLRPPAIDAAPGATAGPDAGQRPHTNGAGSGTVTADGVTAGSSAGAAAGTDDQVFTLIDKAQQAMALRHFIDPVEGSALSLYREALVLEPSNGEARQGTQRIEEILVSRVQAALDERKFDAALQSLETARSIDPDDARLKALDARLAGMRAEIGPTQIQAAITAQNFERASQLIDDAARAKLLPPAKLLQLRDELRRHQAEQDVARLATLIDARIQQDHLIDPARDSALYYLTQARSAGAADATLGAQWQEFYRRGSLAAHAAIDQHRFSDADRWVGELRASGLGVAPLAALQHDLAAARAALPTVQNRPVASPFVDLARTRLASGNVLEPETDSALYYVNQLRATDPQNAALPQLAAATQAQVLERARAALDANQLSRADFMMQLAGALGPSPEAAALDARLQTAKTAAAAAAAATATRGPATVPEASLRRATALTLDYPPEAQRKELQGWVEVGYLVAADGKVSQAHVTNASLPGVFDRAALRAISRLRYQPPQVDGRPGPVLTAVRLVFRFEK